MSFILDALKKSEIERQRQAIPGLIDSGTVQKARGFPLWAVGLVVLLGINLVVLVFVLTRGGAPARPQPAQSRTMQSQAAPSQAAPSQAAPSQAAPSQATEPRAAQSRPPTHFSPLDPAPVFAPEIPPEDIPASTGGSSTMPHPAVAGVHTAHRPEPLLTDEDYKADEEVLPSISDVNLSGQQALPDLHLDVHVYATKPAERFVYINMRKYREGSTLEEGPILERIRRDGVILNFHGLRFLLPRQQ
jgi:general secretion pathway protein B